MESKEAKLFWRMFQFQYKPIEKLALKSLKEQNRTDLITKYKSYSIPQKINFLDRVAGLLGL